MSRNIADEPQVNKWAEHVMAISQRSYEGKLEINLDNADELWGLNMEGSQLTTKIFKNPSLSQSMRNAISTHMNVLKKLMTPFETAQIIGGGPRMQPLTICIGGKTGVGKSLVTIPLTNALLARCLPKEQLPLFQKSYGDFIYGRQIEHEYWDGYRGQFCAVYDDFAQIRDTVGSTKANEFLEIIRNSNMFQNICHMAGMESKGNTVFRSKIIIATTNCNSFASQIHSIVEPQAVDRRFLSIKVGIADNWCKDTSVVPTQREIDMDKVNRDGRAFIPEVYLFYLCDPGNFGKISGQTALSFEELIDFLASKFEEKKRQADKYLAFISKDVNERIEKRRGEIELTSVEEAQATIDVRNLSESMDSVAEDQITVEEYAVTKQFLKEYEMDCVTLCKDAMSLDEDPLLEEISIDDFKEFMKDPTQSMAINRTEEMMELRSFVKAISDHSISAREMDQFCIPIRNVYNTFCPRGVTMTNLQLHMMIYRLNREAYLTAINSGREVFRKYLGKVIGMKQTGYVFRKAQVFAPRISDEDKGELDKARDVIKFYFESTRKFVTKFYENHPHYSMMMVAATVVPLLGWSVKLLHTFISSKMLDDEVTLKEKQDDYVNTWNTNYCALKQHEKKENMPWSKCQPTICPKHNGRFESVRYQQLCDSCKDSDDLCDGCKVGICRNCGPRDGFCIAQGGHYDQSGRTKQKHFAGKNRAPRNYHAPPPLEHAQGGVDDNCHEMVNKVYSKSVYRLFLFEK
jgi:hypothetical protein